MTTMKATKYIFAAMTLAALAACQNDDNINNSEYLNDPDAVIVNATIGELQTRVNTDGNGDTWNADDCIHITNTTNGAVIGKNKAVYTYKDNAWTPAGSGYIVWVDGDNTFEAYYPANTDGSSDISYNSFSLPQRQDKVENLQKADWMTATTTSSKTTDNSISLAFEHRLAKVTVKISGYNNQYGTELPAVSDPHFYEADVDPDDAVKNTDNGVMGYMQSDESGKGKHSFTAILPAGKYSADATFFSLDVEGQTLTVKPAAYLTSEGLEAGKAYTLSLTVGKDAASISSITVTEWGTGWEESGTATPEINLTENETLTNDMISESINNGRLVVKGNPSSDALTTLGSYIIDHPEDINTLDMENCNITEIPANFIYGEKGGSIIETNITTLILPKGTTTIGDKAFFSTEITSITLPETVTTIGEDAFRYGYLTELTIPANVNKIGNRAFQYNNDLSKVYFKGLTPPNTIGTGAFTPYITIIYVPTGTKDAYSSKLTSWRNKIQEYEP